MMDNRTIEEVRENETKLIDEIKQLEKENQKYKKAINELMNYIENNKLILNNPNVLDFYLKVKEVEHE